jgi:hypothetical protein
MRCRRVRLETVSCLRDLSASANILQHRLQHVIGDRIAQQGLRGECSIAEVCADAMTRLYLTLTHGKHRMLAFRTIAL